MPTERMIFSVLGYISAPKNENAEVKLSIKKLAYLKNPSSPRFTKRLNHNNPFLLESLSELSRARAIKKSTSVLNTIRGRKRQSHQP